MATRIPALPSSRVSRRRFLAVAGVGALTGQAAFAGRRASAAPVTIRYATGGGIGPNEMETVIFLDWMKEKVLKRHDKDYTVRMTFTRGTPEAAALLAAGQADMATLAFSTFATAILKDAVPGGLTIVSDNYQDGVPGYANNTYFVRDDSPIKQVADVRGKKVGINAFGSAVEKPYSKPSTASSESTESMTTKSPWSLPMFCSGM